MDQCALTVLAAPGTAPIRCRRRVWEGDPGSGVCYTCHPRGREQAVERVVRRLFKEEAAATCLSDAQMSSLERVVRRLFKEEADLRSKLDDRRILPPPVA